jgi:beta-lactamase superfamily II metal-dependent hydrolase
MEIHFIDVGLGNMTLLRFPNGTTYLVDCNVTDENADAVLAYLDRAMGSRTNIDRFVCSHRDADHMRGIKRVHEEHPINEIRDPGVPGTTTDSAEYEEYMDLRRELGGSAIKARTYRDVGEVRFRFMNSADDDLSDANDQSIVLKVEFGGSSVMLAGDTSFRPWKEKILPYYSDDDLSANILLAAHHGSLAFFDDTSDEKHYYTQHIRKLKPEMTIISVGPNVHDLPDSKAMELYEKYSTGSNKGNKVYTTEDQGNMKLTLTAGGGWNLKTKQ